MTALQVQSLTVHYESSPVLWDIDVTVPQGHLVGILGPNGAGKTTFVKAVLGLIDSIGVVRLLNRPLKEMRSFIAYVPQREQVDWTFPIDLRGLVEMGCYPKRGLFRSLSVEDKNKIDKAIDTVGLTNQKNAQIGQLSGGQQQRAFLARAIVQDADLYFLDEPFGSIDQISEQIVVDLLRSMREKGKTVFIVHHDLVTAGRYFDWAILLNNRLVASGPISEVFTQENLQQTYGKKLALIEDVLQMSTRFVEGSAC